MADANTSTPSPSAKDDGDLINVVLRKEDYRRLSRLLETLRRIDGWCSVNRYLARIILYGGIAALIFLSQGLDAVRNLFSGMGKH